MFPIPENADPTELASPENVLLNVLLNLESDEENALDILVPELLALLSKEEKEEFIEDKPDAKLFLSPTSTNISPTEPIITPFFKFLCVSYMF